ncbi:2,3-diketo-L-gulonate-binding periplasmic protein YiaO [bioreactor metagenome]|uniref:2,3-diketo-L-gulonate-binding periplasmic protein YiaO n=1 Tax=bioreactor metagenome TaxID=1076179 RepID=A0A644ZGE6_9ZZZZ
MCESSQSAYASFTQELMSAGIPFLFKNREAAYAFYDSEVGDQIADAVAVDTGIRIMGYFENGVRQLTNSKRPVVTPADMSGLKIRVMESPLYIEMFTEMGANPMPMSFAELYTALQQGAVDGQDNPYAITSTNKFYEVQKYMTDLSHTFDVTCFSINDDFYQGLPDDIRAIVDEAAAEATAVQRQLSIENEQSYIKTIEDNGVQLTRLTDEQRQAFKDKCDGIYDFFRANYKPSVTLDTVLAKAAEVNDAN